MRVRSNAVRAGLAALSAALAAPMAQAQIFGGPTSGGMGFLPANTEVADGMFWFHNSILLPAITGISLLVLALIIYLVCRLLLEKKKKHQQTTSHALSDAHTV